MPDDTDVPPALPVHEQVARAAARARDQLDDEQRLFGVRLTVMSGGREARRRG